MLSRKAFAKVNFGLSVLDKREDGYHNIESIFQKVDFYDEIFVNKTEGDIAFETNIPPFGDKNICYGATASFFEASGLKGGAEVRLEKKIWQGSGLGGASADTAEVLKALNKVFGYPLTEETLLDIALSLSSDAPFFFNGNTALVSGRGEQITPLELKNPVYLVLVYPGFEIDTPWAYRSLDRQEERQKGDVRRLIGSLRAGDIESFASSLYNDFEAVVFKRYPRLGEIKDNLISNGCLGASLSGSGSVVYGVTNDRGDEDRWRSILGMKDIRTVSCLMHDT